MIFILGVPRTIGEHYRGALIANEPNAHELESTILF